jgi:hypothetical protein
MLLAAELWWQSLGYNNYDWFLCNGSNGVGGTLGATMTGGNGFAFLAKWKTQSFPCNESHAKNNSTTDGLERKTFNDEIQEIPLTLKKNWLVLMMIFFMVRSWNQNSRKK